jgi:hypothetical protein
MAKIHVLDSDGNGVYRVVLHTPVAGGNNSAGHAWTDVVVAAGLNTSILPEGTGIGEISTAELADITAGNVLEIVSSINAESGGATAGSLTALANQIIADRTAQLAQKYKFFGYTQVNGS